MNPLKQTLTAFLVKRSGLIMKSEGVSEQTTAQQKEIITSHDSQIVLLNKSNFFTVIIATLKACSFKRVDKVQKVALL